MNFTLWIGLSVLLLFAGMLGLSEFGRRLGLKQMAGQSSDAWEGLGVVDGAVYALLGLIIAFSFSGAVSRFDERRQLVTREINAIGTAYLRLDLLPVESQSALRESFRRYVDSRIEVYRLLPDIGASKKALDVSNAIQQDVWKRVLAAARDSPAATMLLAPALNEMFDITTTRGMATKVHPPAMIFGLLFGLSLIGAVLAGYRMSRAKSRSWLHMTGFAAVMTIVIYVILDMEFPRFGFIRVDAVDQAFIDLRAGMK